MPESLFDGLETPRLILDRDRLECNAAVMRERCDTLGVTLRPHLKTSKSIDAARVASGGNIGPVTVSTLKEAEHFAAAGWHDILYATALVPAKIARVAAIQRSTGATVHIAIDHSDVVAPLASAARLADTSLSVLIEIDCGEHRSGLPAGAQSIVALARSISDTHGLTLSGVMTHAGHSYGTTDLARVRELARHERDVAVTAAKMIRDAGLKVPIVSIGSTPTVLHADHLDGVTEARAGIYMFWDLSQLSRNMCQQDDIAVSVLASVIGHNHAGFSLVLDAGALALSKDIGAQKNLPDAGYGYVCDANTLERLGALSVTGVHQEHATVAVPDVSWFKRLPIGTLVRILPNHACMTCAAYDRYDVVSEGRNVGQWARINGW